MVCVHSLFKDTGELQPTKNQNASKRTDEEALIVL